MNEHDRQPEDDDREGVARSPDRAEPPGSARPVVILSGDEGRHGHQVVWIERVPQPERERQEQRQEDWTIH